MNVWTYIGRSVWFHRKAHAGALLGALITTAILTGALVVGDSIRAVLNRIALQRLGAIHYAIAPGVRFFTAASADRLAGEVETDVAPVLQLPGAAVADPGSAQQSAQVLGVDARFWHLGGGPVDELADSEVDLSEALAEALQVRPGAQVDLRIRAPTGLPEDAPLSSRSESLFRRRSMRVRRIVPDGQLGRFNLRAEQTAPLNAFVSLNGLQNTAGLAGKANLLLIGPLPPRVSDSALTNALASACQLEDAGLSLARFPSLGLIRIASDSVFLDDSVAASLTRAGITSVGTLTYMVNSISNPASGRSTPYSFVTAEAPSTNRRLSLVFASMKDDEILINRWLADATAATAGTSLILGYFRPSLSGGLITQERSFRVCGVVSMDEAAVEKELVPSFPGLSDVDRCSDWDIGLPMDEHALQDKDNEAYWTRYRQTPKAFVTLAAGQSMWGSRFGNLTALRFPSDSVSEAAIRSAFARAVKPAAFGLQIVPVRRQALLAVAQGLDFGPLFLSMSVFLMASALALTVLLFSFALQQRSSEIATLTALGFSRRSISGRLMAEGAFVALVGAGIGIPAGLGYAQWLIEQLRGPWSAATAQTAVLLSARGGTLALAFASGTLSAIIAMAFSLRRLLRVPAAMLHAGASEGARGLHPVRAWPSLVLSLCSGLAAVLLIVWSRVTRTSSPGEIFFLSGTSLLISGLAALRWALAAISRRALQTGQADVVRLSPAGIVLRNISRRPLRSLTVAGLFASGLFLVVGVSAMALTSGMRSADRHSATGGFAFVATCPIAIPFDLREEDALRRLHLDQPALKNVRFLPIKVKDGDDAGCLNMNRAQSPRLLGVDPEDLLRLGAFAAPGDASNVWSVLRRPLAGGVVPALAADQDTLTWGLKKKADPLDGDILTYSDERGRPFAVRLVGALPHRITVLHGSLLVSQTALAERFPSLAGYRQFLIDAPDDSEQARLAIQAPLQRFGVVAIASRVLLSRFAAVEDTYLRVFSVLGGLGLLLATAGLGAVVFRNVSDRRREFAVLSALGFSQTTLRLLLLAEYWALLLTGVVIGGCAAGVAILPLGPSSGARFTLALVVGAVAAAGLLFVWLASRANSAGNLLPSLRDE